jgi:uncharacterized protein
MVDNRQVINAVRKWVETVVVGLELCPFAKRELQSQRLHFSVSVALTEEELLVDLQSELEVIKDNDAIETTLLIHPHVLQDFFAYNQFLDYADALLLQMGLEGVYQIASFHPDYQFAETTSEDVRNYTNKSPYPMLHLIAEQSVEQAITSYPDSAKVPERNQQLLMSLGRDKMRALRQACFDDGLGNDKGNDKVIKSNDE